MAACAADTICSAEGAAVLLPAHPVAAIDSVEGQAGVHWLPFGIAFDGPVPALDEYFVPQLEQGQLPLQGKGVAAAASSSSGSCLGPVFCAQFRGRRLKGALKQLPDGLTGLLIRPVPSSSSGSDAQQRSWQAEGRFSQLMLWNHDTAPSTTDWHARCIDWLALAQQVHAPVSASQVEAELQQMQAAGLIPAASSGAAGAAGGQS